MENTWRPFAASLVPALLLALASTGCAPTLGHTGEDELRAAGTTPEGELGFYASGGTTFDPLIQVDPGAAVEWRFTGYGGGRVLGVSTSTSSTPRVAYEGTMLATLKVTPWSAVRTIDIGYDASDGGSLDKETYGRENQHVTSVAHLGLVKEGLEIWCSSYNLGLTSLDFSGFGKLETIESFVPEDVDGGLVSIGLAGAASLRRLCLESNNLASLDISDCAALEDLRAAKNAFSSVSWPASMPNLWHVCVRDNPQLSENVPVGRMPALRECYLWNAGQNGAFAPNSTALTEVLIWGNQYTSLDLRGAAFPPPDGRLDAKGSISIASVLVGSSGARDLDLTSDGLGTAAIATLLSDLDSSGVERGSLALAGNPGAVATGSAAYRSLLDHKGWTISD